MNRVNSRNDSKPCYYSMHRKLSSGINIIIRPITKCRTSGLRRLRRPAVCSTGVNRTINSNPSKVHNIQDNPDWHGVRKTLTRSTSLIAMTMFMVLSSWPKVIARVHPVQLMNVVWAPGGRQPSDQANRLGLWVRRKLAAIIHIHHFHCYYYSARRLILILPSYEGRKAKSA